jgi:hypothetical protein
LIYSFEQSSIGGGIEEFAQTSQTMNKSMTEGLGAGLTPIISKKSGTANQTKMLLNTSSVQKTQPQALPNLLNNNSVQSGRDFNKQS